MDFITMQNRIAREVRFEASAFASGLQEDIKLAILDAIKTNENKLFWFNEVQATTVTVAGEEYYPLPDGSDADSPPCIQVESLTVIGPTGLRPRSVEQITFEEAEEINYAAESGRPRNYCIFNMQLRIVPIPDAEHTLRMSYISKVLPTLVNDTDTNAWLTDAEALIRAEAKARLYQDRLHNPEKAAEFAKRAELEYYALAERTRQFMGGGVIRQQAF